MKHLRKFNESFNEDSYIIDDIHYDGPNYIVQIDLKDGRKIVTGEDTGGEDTSLECECKLNIGDEISFEYDHKDGNCLMGVTSIIVNGNRCGCSVGSEGGNTDTFLVIEN